MEKLGLSVGVAWTTMAGFRMFKLEREFDSLAAHEADDAAFHGMETALWQTRGTSDEVAALRVRR